ncbi:MAG: S10 family peptidase [Tepidisphaerales bacterium]
MNLRPALFTASAVFLAVLVAARAAQTLPDPTNRVPEAASRTAEPSTRPAEPVSTTTEHTLTVGTTTYRYAARPDFITLRDDTGKPLARFFHISYTLLEPKVPVEQRPVTFVFNGGPGSSSVWLHLGAVGPRRVVMTDAAVPPPPPGRLESNPDSWLPATDLVFIDPVGTGFSRAEPGVDASQFYSVDGDVSSIAEFIRIYLSRNQRWASPKYLAGESYGTTRAAALSLHLSRRQGIDLSGIILVSTVLEFATIRDVEGNDLPMKLFLPGYTATAYHHRRLPAELLSRPLEDVLAEAERFAVTTYAQALAAGFTLPQAELDAVAAEYARLTGLPRDVVVRNHLRVAPRRFFSALLADQLKVVGRFDGTITGFDSDPGGVTPEYDPSYTAYQGAYTSAINAYLRGELKFESEQRYEVLAGLPWTFPQGQFVNVAGQLADAMVQNPHLRVLVASGYQDLATPYFAARYTLQRMLLPPEGRSRVTVREYYGGHMMYHHAESLRRLGEDVRQFIESAAEAP